MVWLHDAGVDPAKEDPRVVEMVSQRRAGKSGHRSGTEVARGRRGGCSESDPAEERNPEAVVL